VVVHHLRRRAGGRTDADAWGADANAVGGGQRRLSEQPGADRTSRGENGRAEGRVQSEDETRRARARRVDIVPNEGSARREREGVLTVSL
jgi:hypothetical protein